MNSFWKWVSVVLLIGSVSLFGFRACRFVSDHAEYSRYMSLVTAMADFSLANELRLPETWEELLKWDRGRSNGPPLAWTADEIDAAVRLEWGEDIRPFLRRNAVIDSSGNPSFKVRPLQGRILHILNCSRPN